MSSPDHGSTVTPLKSAAWEQVKAMRAAAEDQGDDYPPPPGARGNAPLAEGRGRTARRRALPSQPAGSNVAYRAVKHPASDVLGA